MCGSNERRYGSKGVLIVLLVITIDYDVLSVCGCHLRVLLLHLSSMSFVSAKAQLMENPLMLHGPRFTVRLDSNPCLFETFETYFEVMNSF